MDIFRTGHVIYDGGRRYQVRQVSETEKPELLQPHQNFRRVAIYPVPEEWLSQIIWDKTPQPLNYGETTRGDGLLGGNNRNDTRFGGGS